MKKMHIGAGLAALALTLSPGATAAEPTTLETTVSPREAMDALAFLDGEWRGDARYLTPDGWQHFVQTERVGTMLDGDVRVIEGRGYLEQGTPVFAALAVLSWDAAAEGFRMTSWAQGRHGESPFKRTDDGFSWEMPSPQGVIRYTAVVEGSQWRQTGERVIDDAETVRFFEMELHRIGDTGWPDEGPVSWR